MKPGDAARVQSGNEACGATVNSNCFERGKALVKPVKHNRRWISEDYAC